MSLKSALIQRLDVLKNRHTNISDYVRHPNEYIGKKYTIKDIHKIEKQIEETGAALSGINQWLKDERNKDLLEIK